ARVVVRGRLKNISNKKNTSILGDSMEKYRELIRKLEQNGVCFAEGLSDKELFDIQYEYNVNFLKSLKVFYKAGLLISDGFHNWREISKKNIKKIKTMMNYPFDSVRENYDEIDWINDLDEEFNDKKSIIYEKLNNAPSLIPIFSHRYISTYEEETEDTPIFSINDVDVIYYGENLYSYLQMEFGLKDYSDMDEEKIAPVPFWSNLI